MPEVSNDPNMNESENPGPQFIETEITSQDTLECGDGRPGVMIVFENGVPVEHPMKPGPKIFGGDAAFAKMRCDFEKVGTMDETYISETAEKLKQAGFKVGIHRDDQANPAQGKCGCGRCDRSVEITQAKIDHASEFKQSIDQLSSQLSERGIHITPEIMDQVIADAQNSQSRNDLAGEALVAAFEKAGATTETVKGPHQETKAFLNLKPGVTLNKQALFDQGHEAFCVDVLPGLDRAEALKIDRNYAAAWILVDSLATRQILAPDVSLEIHS